MRYSNDRSVQLLLADPSWCRQHSEGQRAPQVQLLLLKQCVCGRASYQCLIRPLQEGAREQRIPVFQVAQQVARLDHAVADLKRVRLAIGELARDPARLQAHSVEVHAGGHAVNVADGGPLCQPGRVRVVRLVHGQVLLVERFHIVDGQDQVESWRLSTCTRLRLLGRRLQYSFVTNEVAPAKGVFDLGEHLLQDGSLTQRHV